LAGGARPPEAPGRSRGKDTGELMARAIAPGDCVRIADGRIGRVRAASGATYRVRVRRKSSKAHQFLVLSAAQVEPVDCPRGWMRPAAYLRYLRITLAKMRQREVAQAKSRRRRRRRVR